MHEMSLIAQVVRMVRAAGTATVDDLAPKFQNHTRDQVMQALQNARSAGKVRVAKPRETLGHRGFGPATYELRPEYVPPAPIAPPVSSIWELGDRAATQTGAN